MSRKFPKILKIEVGSHYFVVRCMRDLAQKLCYKFAKLYFTKVNLPDKPGDPPSNTVFATALKNRSQFRFHVNSLSFFLKILETEGIHETDYDIKHLRIHPGDHVEWKIKPQWTLRDYQVPMVDYLKAKPPPRIKFIGLQTGKGKTFVALYAVAQLKTRLCIIVKPMYIKKWVEDIKKTFIIEDENILTVEGTPELIAYLKLVEQKKADQYHAVIISNKTYSNWLKNYEFFNGNPKDIGYPFDPDELYSKAGFGIKLVDEVHQDFHMNFRIDLYSHVERSISLSATLLNNDPFIERMYDTAYPIHQRCDVGSLDKYIDSTAICYQIQKHRRYKTSEFGRKTYSHNAFEKSILKDKDFFKNYARLVEDLLDQYYLDKNYKPGQKAIVFASTVNMCSELTEYLSARFKDKTVKRYVSGDPYSNLLEPDIRVTTLGSGGTAHDISNLTTVILTIAVDSVQSNIQSLGRLRYIEGVQTKFVYMTCTDIPKHRTYYRSKQEMLKHRAKSASMLIYSYPV